MVLVAVGEGVAFPQTALQCTCCQMSADKGDCFGFPSLLAVLRWWKPEGASQQALHS